MPTIKFKGKKLEVSEGDLRGIKEAIRLGAAQVDVQQPVDKKKTQFKDVWLETAEIEL